MLVTQTLQEDLRVACGTITDALGAEVSERVYATQLDNLTRAFRWLDDRRVFVLTGDIPAMWLRDSAAQVRPLVLWAGESAEIARMIRGVLASQWYYIAHDPYANAFNAEPTQDACHSRDLCQDPLIWERKYEVDSLAFPVQLAWQLWRITGDTSHLDEAMLAACRRIIATWRREQRHFARSDYRFIRPKSRDTLGRDGRGRPVAITGMTWSGFRPSDDPCKYGYNIPAQHFAIAALTWLIEMNEQAWRDVQLAEAAHSLADELSAGVEGYGLLRDGTWAYEVDGLGSQLAIDDANMPSLLSLPLCSLIAADDERYLATRSRVLSRKNRYWYSGRAASGIGSPHTPRRHVWPIALAVQGLTSLDESEAERMVALLMRTDADTGRMHESFHVNNPNRYTRGWFSWADSMFAELAFKVAGYRLPTPGASAKT